MKKGWLNAVIAFVMAVVMCFGFVGCGASDEDAKAALAYVKTRYDGSAKTADDYEVMGVVPVQGKEITVNWSVAAKTEGVSIGDYVVVGTLNETTKMVPIKVTQGDKDVDYTLTATVGSQHVDFPRTVPKTVAMDNDGTAEKPYTVAEALALGAPLASGAFLNITSNGGKSAADAAEAKGAMIHIAGYVTNVGTLNNYNGKIQGLQNVYIADTKGSTETLKVSFVHWGDEGGFNDMKTAYDSNGKNPLSVDDYVVINGTIENYNSSVNMYYVKDGAGNYYYPEFTVWTQAEKTPDQITSEVRDAIKGEIPARIAVDKTIALTTKGARNATVDWAVTKAAPNGVTFKVEADGEGKKLTVAALPATEGTATLTATIKSGTTEKKVDFEIKLCSVLIDATNDGSSWKTPMSTADAQKVLETLVYGEIYQKDGKDAKMYVNGKVSIPGAVNGTYGLKNTYIAADADKSKDESVCCYNLNWSNNYVPKTEDNTNPLTKGDEITVSGYLQVSATGEAMIHTGKDGTSTKYATFEAWKLNPNMTADQKIALAMKYAPSSLVIGPGETALPTTDNLPTKNTKVQGVTFTYALKSGDAATLADGKLNVAQRPTEDKKVVVTLTAACEGGTSKTKDITVTVAGPKGSDVAQAYTVDEAWKVIDGLKHAEYYGGSNPIKVFVKGIVVDVDSASEKDGKVTFMIADAADSKNKIKVYNLAYDAEKGIGSKDDLVEGSAIVLSGAFELYNSDHELVSYSSVTLTIESYTKAAQADQGQVTLKGSNLLGYAGSNINYGSSTGEGKEVNGVTFQWKELGAFSENGGSLQWRKNKNDSNLVSTLWNTTPFAENVTKVVLTWYNKNSLTKENKMTIEFSSAADFAADKTVTVEIDWNGGDTVKEVTPTTAGEYKYVRITYAGSNSYYISSIAIF